MPSASTVAKVMALGSRGSVFAASSSQAENSRSGSSACVKSPVVNQLGCSIAFVSDISLSALTAVSRNLGRVRYNGTPALRLWRGSLGGLVIGLGLMLGGCSIDIDSVFSSSGQSEITGSVKKGHEALAAAQLPPEPDLALTR